jgi:Fe2+ transport system protein B
MNSETCCQKTRTGAYVIGILGTFLVMALLIWLMRTYTSVPSLAETTAANRMQIMAEFKAANSPLLEKYHWQDESHGIVRIPVEAAKELVLSEWKDPAAGRSNLLARAAKAFAPAPKVLPKPNKYD